MFADPLLLLYTIVLNQTDRRSKLFIFLTDSVHMSTDIPHLNIEKSDPSKSLIFSNSFYTSYITRLDEMIQHVRQNIPLVTKDQIEFLVMLIYTPYIIPISYSTYIL